MHLCESLLQFNSSSWEWVESALACVIGILWAASFCPVLYRALVCRGRGWGEWGGASGGTCCEVSVVSEPRVGAQLHHR